MTNAKKPGASRRDLLKMVGAGAPAALAVGAVGAVPAQAAPGEAQPSGLRKTEHVKKYLETARF